MSQFPPPPTRRAVLKSSVAVAGAVAGAIAGAALLKRIVMTQSVPSEAALLADEAPDRRRESGYFENSIKNISDAELFAAMDLSRPELRAVREAVARKDYRAAYIAWAEHWPAVARRAQFVGDESPAGNSGLVGHREEI